MSTESADKDEVEAIETTTETCLECGNLFESMDPGADVYCHECYKTLDQLGFFAP